MANETKNENLQGKESCAIALSPMQNKVVNLIRVPSRFSLLLLLNISGLLTYKKHVQLCSETLKVTLLISIPLIRFGVLINCANHSLGNIKLEEIPFSCSLATSVYLLFEGGDYEPGTDRQFRNAFYFPEPVLILQTHGFKRRILI